MVLCLCFMDSRMILKSKYSSRKTVKSMNWFSCYFQLKGCRRHAPHSRDGHGAVRTACLHRPLNSCFDIKRHSGSVRRFWLNTETEDSIIGFFQRHLEKYSSLNTSSFHYLEVGYCSPGKRRETSANLPPT